MLTRRAQALLGTMVSMSVLPGKAQDAHAYEAGDEARNMACNMACHEACDEAFMRIAHIGRVMSAHHDDSDLAALASARPGDVLRVDPDTVAVLRLARHWSLLSAQAFDPVAAAMRLFREGQRPGLQGRSGGAGCASFGGFADLEFLGPETVKLARPVRLDLGGIAKGYAVDEAVHVLIRQGLHAGLVNAGGDMRAFGPVRWPVQVRHAGQRLNDRAVNCLRYLENAALASSVAAPLNASFVASGHAGRRRHAHTSCTVLAADCVTADALTKWGLHGIQGDPRLHRCLRARRARLWTSE